MWRRLYSSRGVSSEAIRSQAARPTFSQRFAMVGGLLVVIACCWEPAWAVADSTCENEGLRTIFGSLSMPDCRAYEMVSPPYKEGYPFFVANRSTDGEKAILTSLGSIDSLGAGESASRGTVYLATRTASGWQRSSLEAPSSEFVGQVPIAFEPASGETLWEQHTPEESIDEQGMYLRTAGPNPTYRFIGPLNTPFEGESQEPSTSIYLSIYHTTRPIAATDDYEHVVLEAGDSEDRWPFDATAASEQSLYEYSGTDNGHPILVGVRGPEKGSTDLIGLCGTKFGGGFVGSTYNAISQDGGMIFFTVLSEAECGGSAPKSTEIYARSNGALIDPGPAVTTDVSESTCTIACGSEESGKNFEGASEDGERVFFTSTQKLTNDAMDGTASGNAAEGGGCSRTERNLGGCNLYEYRFDVESGPHLRLIAGGEVLGVAGIAENGSRIYFVSRDEIGSAGKNQFDQGPLTEQPNLYVYDAATGDTAFIATLGEQDSSDWNRSFSSRSTEVGGEGGRYLLFQSAKQALTPDDTRKIAQLFEYDASTRELARLTKGEDAYDEDGNGAQEGVPASWYVSSASLLGGGTDFQSTADRLNMSTDGRTVAFETGGRLSVRAASAEEVSPFGLHCFSVYEFHSAGPLDEGTVHLISDGRDTQIYKGSTCGAQFQAISPSGADIMFETDDPLLPGDIDGFQRDIYDARVEGGFPVVEAAQASACGESCEGTSSATPVFSSPTSSVDSGEASVVGPVPANNKPPGGRHMSKKRHGKRRRGGKAGSRRLHKRSTVRAAKGRR